MTLHLTLKKQFFNEILSGEKTKEYKEVKPYWIKRLCNIGTLIKDESTLSIFGVSEQDLKKGVINECKNGKYTYKKFTSIIFKNGYQTNAPEFEIECLGIEVQNNISTSLGYGSFFVLHLGKILNKRNIQYGQNK